MTPVPENESPGAMNDAAALRRAEALLEESRLDEAAALARDVVAARPRDARALELLGRITARRGQADEALAWLERARDCDPGLPDPWRSLGLVYRQLGRLPESIAAYERALAIDAEDPAAYVNLAVAVKAAGDLPRAVAHLKRAIALAPDLRPAYFNLGNCLFDLRDLDGAGAAYLTCLRLNPRDTEAAIGIARVFRDQQRFDMAEKTLKAALRLTPDDADVAATLGALLHDANRSDEARAILGDVLAQHPRNLRALRHLGNVERDAGNWRVAEKLYRQALEVTPDNPDALLELSAALAELGDRPGALALLDRIRELHPNDADVRRRCAIVLLGEGELAQGWSEYAAMRTRRSLRFAHLPRLESASLAGRKVVIWGDQGVGDEILYGSMLMDLRRHAAQIVCEIDRRLVPLFERGLPELTFVPRSFTPDISVDASEEAVRKAWRAAPLDRRFHGATHQIALPDLGQWLRGDLASFPRHDAYLRAAPDRIAEIRHRLAPRDGERLVGVSWRSRNPEFERYKSMDLRTMVAALPGTRLVNLQYGDVTQEIDAVRRELGREVEILAGFDYFNDIDGVAALVAACDAVVSVSTAAVHLAGALGRPTALLCPRHGNPWYWFRNCPDTPWYPSLRIFRQTMAGDWAPALNAATSWISSVMIARDAAHR